MTQLTHVANSSHSRSEDVSLEMSLFQRRFKWKSEISFSQYSTAQKEVWTVFLSVVALGDEKFCTGNTVCLFINTCLIGRKIGHWKDNFCGPNEDVSKTNKKVYLIQYCILK